MTTIGHLWFCGCCGRRIEGVGCWCVDCAKHLSPADLPDYERIYSARHQGKPCPYQIAARTLGEMMDPDYPDRDTTLRRR